MAIPRQAMFFFIKKLHVQHINFGLDLTFEESNTNAANAKASHISLSKGPNENQGRKCATLAPGEVRFIDGLL
jgi:hypothetical protein